MKGHYRLRPAFIAMNRRPHFDHGPSSSALAWTICSTAAALVLAACGNSSEPSSSAVVTPLARTATAVRFVALANACGNATPRGTLDPQCTAPPSPDGNEPACNPSLAQSAWPAAHRGNYAQASSPWPGVGDGSGDVAESHIDIGALAIPVILAFSEPDNAGNTVMWSSAAGYGRQILKLDPDHMRLIDKIKLKSSGTISTSGAYNLLDRDQNLIVGEDANLHVYGDAQTGNHFSPIADLKDYPLPPSALCRSDDVLVGITMLPDGYVGFATKYGVIGTIPRYPEAMCDAALVTYSLNGSACSDSSVPADKLEQVSNSIAADEDSNLYVVTSNAQYRIDWDGQHLTQHWRAAYPGAGGTGDGRLGSGSGSTPTLMGTHPDDDRFVVITDGEQLMHLILMWRDEVPAGWQPIAPGLDPRIACDVPMDFGDPTATASLSEQSVLVRGYSSVVVNNLLHHQFLLNLLPPDLAPLVELFSGTAWHRPYGLERVDWNPTTKSCNVVWANPDISIPNGVPTMSVGSDTIYGVGSRTLNGKDTWTLEGLDFNTGASRFYVPAGPQWGQNSMYAATEVGPGNSVWTGTFGGITRYQSCTDISEGGCVAPVRP